MAIVNYLSGRLLRLATVIAGLVVITFFLTRLVADPVALILGASATDAQREQLRASMGLDQPLPQQFGNYLLQLLRGDLGDSAWLGQPAFTVIVERLPASIVLATLAMLLALVVGVGAGIAAGLQPDSWLDRIITSSSAFISSIPDFWVGIILIIVFAVNLGWFPTGGYHGPAATAYLVLPTITVALLPAGRLARIARQSVIDELGKPYVVAARARGLTTAQIIRHHVLKNIMVSVGQVAGYDYLLLFTGYIATLEVVFGWPGIGRLAVEATLQEDVVLISALVIVTGMIVGLGNIVLDAIFALIDPRSSN